MEKEAAAAGRRLTPVPSPIWRRVSEGRGEASPLYSRWHCHSELAQTRNLEQYNSASKKELTPYIFFIDIFIFFIIFAP
jgi:hypothetical protein